MARPPKPICVLADDMGNGDLGTSPRHLILPAAAAALGRADYRPACLGRRHLGMRAGA